MTWFVHRRGDGTIASAHAEKQEGYAEEVLADNAPDLVAFMTPAPAAAALAQLEQNDAMMFRALEVLVDALLGKGVIAATDFPPAVRQLYQQRKALRAAAGVP